MAMYELTEGTPLTSNGSTSVFEVRRVVDEVSSNSQRQTWTVIAAGTWDGATLTLEFGPTENGPWVSTTESAFTDDAIYVSPASRSVFVRGTLSSAGASTSVDLWLG